MKMKDLKAELDDLGVAWRGVCFEKEDLVRALEDARANPPSPAPAPAPPEVEVYTSSGAPAGSDSSSSDRFGGFGSAMAQAEAEAAEVNAMPVDAIKAELDQLNASYGADDDKAKLVSELLNARAFNRPMFDTSQFGNQGTQW